MLSLLYGPALTSVDDYWKNHCCCSVANSCPALWDLMNCSMTGFASAFTIQPSPSPGVCSNSCPLSRWCHPTISFSFDPFSSCFQSFSASGSFPMSRLFTSNGQNIGASVSTLVLPMNIQCWFPLGLTVLISFLYEGLSRVFSSITVQRHKFFGAQLFLLSSSHIHTWLLEKP